MPDPTLKFDARWQTRKTLIQRVAGSCEASWQEFFLIYKGFVSSIASRRGVAPADIDDVIQRIFLEVHKDFNREEPPDFTTRSFGAWLGQKIKWRVGEYHRHRHRREIPTEPEHLHDTNADDPFDPLWQAEWERKLVEVALQKVSEKPRNLLIFYALAIQSLPMEDVCEMFNLSQSNAYTIRNRVKEKLKPIIREIEAGEF